MIYVYNLMASLVVSHTDNTDDDTDDTLVVDAMSADNTLIASAIGCHFDLIEKETQKCLYQGYLSDTIVCMAFSETRYWLAFKTRTYVVVMCLETKWLSEQVAVNCDTIRWCDSGASICKILDEHDQVVWRENNMTWHEQYCSAMCEEQAPWYSDMMDTSKQETWWDMSCIVDGLKTSI